MFYKNFEKNKKKGMATLPTIMVLGMITLAIAVSITSIAFNESLTSQGSSQSSRALSYAEAGARDALLKISLNKDYSCTSTDCYSIDFTTDGCSLISGCAKVSVSADPGDVLSPKLITSKGIVNLSMRTIEVRVVLDEGTNVPELQHGLITSTTWKEKLD